MSRPKGTIFTYIVSCSSDAERPFESLYVWGEFGEARWLASTPKEAQMRVDACRAKMGCRECDAEIHRVPVVRVTETLLQSRRQEEYHKRKCE
jgi:hypothetical protein